MMRATFAGGCYWGTEKFFRKEFKSNIKDVQVGFMGGANAEPTYRQVCSGNTGHAEVVSFLYDPTVVRYDDLVLHFFRMHNPTTPNRQGNDVGTQYRSAIFVHSPEQKEIALAWIARLNDPKDEYGAKIKQRFDGAPIATTVEEGQTFYPAHEEHQDYLTKNASGYCNHRLYW